MTALQRGWQSKRPLVKNKRPMSIQSVDFDQRNPSSVVHAAHESKAYLAGIVFTSAAIEYILAAWLRAFDILKFAKHKKKLTEHWSLKELNDLEPASITA